ncbi:MAG: GNAT family N-acetyltransferase [Euzebya sp.]
MNDYSSDAVLKDGQTIHLRPIRPDDLDGMMALWDRLSAETIRLRFFGPRRMDAGQMRHLVEVDRRQRFALVAHQHDQIVGVGRFDLLDQDPTAAEFALTVQDSQQGRGIGTALLRALMAPARDLGVTHFHGDILSENRSMLRVMRQAGFEPSMRLYGPTISAIFTTTPTETLLRRAGEQDRQAAQAALTSVLNPASVAKDPPGAPALIPCGTDRCDVHTCEFRQATAYACHQCRVFWRLLLLVSSSSMVPWVRGCRNVT